MKSHASKAAPRIRLPLTTAIGFSGHRSLPDQGPCRRLIHDFLRERQAAPGTIYGITSVAAGGDLVFAESCLELEIPLRVLLPFPVERFRNDFDAATWARAENAMRKAVSVEVTGRDEPREEGYYRCGLEVLLQSQMLVALWNGEPARGLGGTENIVALAQAMGRPVVWFHSVTGERRILHEEALAALSRDPELEFLDGLPDLGVELESDSRQELAQAWFRKLDENANRFAPRSRRLAAAPLLCTAAAALFSEAGAWTQTAGIWLGAGAALGLVAVLLPAALRLEQREVLWSRTRTAAEICRSFLAFWNAPGAYDAVGPEVVPELGGVLASLNYLKLADRGASEAPLEEFKSRYRQERVAAQIAYFSRHAARAAAAVRRYRAATWTFIALAVAINVWLFAAGPGVARLGPEWWALAASVAFQAATVAGALLAMNDAERRRARYEELQRQLEHWDAELGALATWFGVLGVARRVERALLAELIEWRSLIRHRRHGRG